MAKVIAIDSEGRAAVADRVIVQGLRQADADKSADRLNREKAGQGWYYAAVNDEYKLNPGSTK